MRDAKGEVGARRVRARGGIFFYLNLIGVCMTEGNSRLPAGQRKGKRGGTLAVRDIWVRADLVPALLLLADSSMVTGVLSLEFLFFSALALVPLFLSLFLLEESGHLMGRRFLRGWNLLTVLFSYSLLGFGLIFFLHFTTIGVVMGLVSVVFGVGHRVYVKRLYTRLDARARVKEKRDRERLEALRRRKKKPVSVQDLREREREFYRRMAKRLREEGIDVEEEGAEGVKGAE